MDRKLAKEIVKTAQQAKTDEPTVANYFGFLAKTAEEEQGVVKVTTKSNNTTKSSGEGMETKNKEFGKGKEKDPLETGEETGKVHNAGAGRTTESSGIPADSLQKKALDSLRKDSIKQRLSAITGRK